MNSGQSIGLLLLRINPKFSRFMGVVKRLNIRNKAWGFEMSDLENDGQLQHGACPDIAAMDGKGSEVSTVNKERVRDNGKTFVVDYWIDRHLKFLAKKEILA